MNFATISQKQFIELMNSEKPIHMKPAMHAIYDYTQKYRILI